MYRAWKGWSFVPDQTISKRHPTGSLLERDPAVRADQVIRPDLAATLWAEQGQLRAAGRANCVVLAERSAALGAEGLTAGGALWRTGRDGSAALRAGRALLEPAARANGLAGQKYHTALGTDPRAALWARPARWHKVGPADRADCPAHDLLADVAG